jgi:Na+/H+ antiporter NhaD/arsenite permease-like protein
MQLRPSILSDARNIAAYGIFFASYFVFALGKFPGLKIDRPGAAIIGAVLMVAFRIMTAQEALRAVDFSTIVLLFSMTLIVAHLHLGGFFTWVADLTVLRLNPQQLLAAVGAAVLLITRTTEPRLVYDEVDWGLLVFFVGLFIIVGGAERAGLTAKLLQPLIALNLHQIWIWSSLTALLSNVVSNVPAVVLLKSLVPAFPDPRVGWLTLAMSSTLAGNLTITGSVANIIVVERARPEVHIGFREYFRLGLPLTVLTLTCGIIWLSLVT